MSTRTLFLNDTLYEYLKQHSLRESEVLRDLREFTSTFSTSVMQISPEQGQFMAFLAKLIMAKKTIEVGVYTGYSALSVAQVLPEDGKMIACDINEEWTELAQTYWERAKVNHKIDLRIGPAEDTLNKLIQEGQEGQYDFAFIDADKTSYDRYYEQCLTLLRKGGIIIIDNVLLDGKVADPLAKDEDTLALRALNEKIYRDERVSMTLLPIGDGLTLVSKH
jgi:predicted O-methyltransferase YrrM